MKIRYLLPVAISLLSTSANAGPPLPLEDPGMLEPGQWEIIAAVTSEKTSVDKTWQVPVLDISLGITPDIQVSAVIPRAVHELRGESSKSGLGIGELGIKWLAWSEGGLDIALAPAYEFNLSDSSKDRGVIEDTHALTLPVVVEKALGDWAIGGQFGYVWVQDDRDELGWGIYATHPISTSVVALGSIYGGPDKHFDNHGTATRIGLDITVTEALHVLLGIGTGLENDPDSIDLDGFLGIQWFP